MTQTKELEKRRKSVKFDNVKQILNKRKLLLNIRSKVNEKIYLSLKIHRGKILETHDVSYPKSTCNLTNLKS